MSERLEDLEKLDKTCLPTVHGMYALKQRWKKFHDSHISTKEFKLGDLVLLFTLKQFVSKFTKQGQGPYVISANGMGNLSTLDSKEMANWINGCRIKKYNTLLTTLRNYNVSIKPDGDKRSKSLW